MARNSILDYFLDNAEQHGSRTAALVKRDGVYREVTWKEMAGEARRISSGLIELGINPGDRVCIMANTSLQWVLADMGILGAGAVCVSIYPSLLADEAQYIADDCSATAVFAEDAVQVAKFLEVKSKLPNVKKVIQMTGEVATNDEIVVGYQDLLGAGRPDAAILDARRKSLNKDSVLCLIYTSGTTGKPKGVVLTHDAMMYEAEAIAQIDVVREDDVQLLFLPLAHSFAKVLEMAWLSVRHVMAFAESMQTIKENLAEVRPTLMAGVPRVYEKFHAAIVAKGTAGGGFKASLFGAAATLSQKNGEAQMAGGSLGPVDSIEWALLKKVIFAKVGAGLEQILGGRMRVLISGGAPLSRKIAWFFRDAGVTVLEGYGLTETSAATCVNRPTSNRIGTVGPALPGTELRIAEDGEILVRGRGVMREYWGMPEATAEALKDGWFHTGDVGVVDPDGALRITDRKKDIIVTAGGKNVAPQNIENLVKTHKLISQVVVHGDKRKFLTALITLDPEALSAFAEERGLGNGSYAELTQKPEVHAEIQQGVDTFNDDLAKFETIKKFKILEADFTQESGELTPSLKVKRKVINDRYKKVFDSFYEERY
jgi:long-chain acyl-CoA synthetase